MIINEELSRYIYIYIYTYHFLIFFGIFSRVSFTSLSILFESLKSITNKTDRDWDLVFLEVENQKIIQDIYYTNILHDYSRYLLV